MAEPRILDEDELSAYEHDIIGHGQVVADLLATVRWWQATCDSMVYSSTESQMELAHQRDQALAHAREATRRAEAAEERCEALSEALVAVLREIPVQLVGHCDCGSCAGIARARALLEDR